MSQSQPSARRIESVYAIPPEFAAKTPAEAIALIVSFDESNLDTPFGRYEVGVRYSNGDEVRGQFKDKATAVAFLHSMR